MPKQVFMRVQEVAAELGVSVPYAYKLIRNLNEELKATGCITIAGRIDRKFFHEKALRNAQRGRKGENRWRHLRTRRAERGMCSFAIRIGAASVSRN